MSKTKLLRFSAKGLTDGPMIGVAVIDEMSVECYIKFYDRVAPTSAMVLQSPDYKHSYNSLDDMITCCLKCGFIYLKFYV